MGASTRSTWFESMSAGDGARLSAGERVFPFRSLFSEFLWQSPLSLLLRSFFLLLRLFSLSLSYFLCVSPFSLFLFPFCFLRYLFPCISFIGAHRMLLYLPFSFFRVRFFVSSFTPLSLCFLSFLFSRNRIGNDSYLCIRKLESIEKGNVLVK